MFFSSCGIILDLLHVLNCDLDLESGGGLGGGSWGGVSKKKKKKNFLYFFFLAPPGPIPSALPHLLACLVLSLVCIVYVLLLLSEFLCFIYNKIFVHALINVCPASKK